MTVRSRYLLAAALGLSAGQAVSAGEPAPHGLTGQAALPATAAPSANQKMADSIADQLRQSGQLRRYSIDITFAEGTADLSGTVADSAQRDEALRLVQGLPGVERVRDKLQLAAAGVRQVADVGNLPGPVGVPGPFAGAPGIPEPQPLFQMPGPSPFDVNTPKMPPHAWPTYAPYNNLSRVGYPTAYPYQAWPFIGPMYPFPKVPPGWRAIKLEWQDGHWWYSKVATPHDWWRVRYY